MIGERLQRKRIAEATLCPRWDRKQEFCDPGSGRCHCLDQARSTLAYARKVRKEKSK